MLEKNQSNSLLKQKLKVNFLKREGDVCVLIVTDIESILNI